MTSEEVRGEVSEIADILEGKLVVSLEDEDWEKMSPGVKGVLVLKLANGMAFNLTGLSNVLSKIWNLQLDKKVRFKELANNMALAEFMNTSDMTRVKEGGPWICMGTFVLLHDWCSDLAPEEFVMNRLGVWVQLHNLPIGAVMSENATGEKLARYIGSFVKVDTKESKKKYVRVRVEIDIEQPVVQGFFLRRLQRDPLWISVQYERLPSLCPKCKRLNHRGEECPAGEPSNGGDSNGSLKEKVAKQGSSDQKGRMRTTNPKTLQGSVGKVT
ncbi:hypothetical protein QQ045_005607 [Rhodiola kirilowii]